jgi:hypothetical protein
MEDKQKGVKREMKKTDTVLPLKPDLYKEQKDLEKREVTQTQKVQQKMKRFFLK